MADNKINFTKKAINNLPIPAKGTRAYYYDTKQRGLGLRITAGNTRTFLVYRWVQGKPERITLGRFPDLTIEQARGQAAQVSSAIASGENPAENRRSDRVQMTFGNLFNEYLERHLKAKQKRWDQDLGKFNRYLTNRRAGGVNLARKKLSSIRTTDIVRLHNRIGATHPVTANRVLGLVSRVFGRAIKWGYWDGPNPARGVDKFREQSRDRFLQFDELPRFFEALSKEPNETIRDYILISLLTGARRANVLAMKWDQISFERGEWRIPRTKNNTPQTIPLTQAAVDILSRRKPLEPATYVFPGAGKSGHLVEPKKGWKRILERAGLSDLRIHDLRRTLGSWEASTGASAFVIGKTLGHRSVSTTAIYARLSLDPVRRAMETATNAMSVAGGLVEGADVVKLNPRKKARRSSVKGADQDR